MPLDNRKAAHIQDVLPKTWTGRQKTVVFVSTSAGSYSYTAVAVLFRPHNVIDPQIPDLVGRAPGVPADVTLIAPIGTNFTGVVYIADTPTASAVAVASKYEIIEAVPVGILPTGSHYHVSLRRLR